MITIHAQDRIHERLGYRAEKAARIATNAFFRGLAPSDLNSQERRYLRVQESKEGCIARLYNGYCYIFAQDGTCITMYVPPKWFGSKDLFVGKERIRNRKKYYCRYDIDGCLEHRMTGGVSYGI